MTERTELTTKRLLLRPYVSTDLDDLIENTRDPESGLYYDPLPVPPTREDAEGFIRRRISDDWKQGAVFAAVLDNRIVGEFCLINVDDEDHSAEIGYFIAKDHRGVGLAGEGAAAVIDWGFTAYRLEKIWAEAQVSNHQSRRVMEKLGMKREGIRSGGVYMGESVEEIRYGLLSGEWQSQHAGL